MNNKLIVCFYNHERIPKRGTGLRPIVEIFKKRGITCTYSDREVEPDVYIFENRMCDTKYKKPSIVRAQTLLTSKDVKTNTFDQGSAMVFNSKWLQTIYHNTYKAKHQREWIIPPCYVTSSHERRQSVSVEKEQNIYCLSKWWKRPYKRLPLIATAFNYLNTNLGHINAKLHVIGWLSDSAMPYFDTFPKLQRPSRKILKNKNIIFHNKTFSYETMDARLSNAHLLVHLSPVDNSPKCVMEALGRKIPVLISNNNGAVEWLQVVGERGGHILNLDPVTKSFDEIQKLIPELNFDFRKKIFSKRGQIVGAVYRYYKYYRLCKSVNNYKLVAHHMKKILDDYASYQFELPYKYTPEGVADKWLEVIHSVQI